MFNCIPRLVLDKRIAVHVDGTVETVLFNGPALAQHFPARFKKPPQPILERTERRHKRLYPHATREGVAKPTLVCNGRLLNSSCRGAFRRARRNSRWRAGSIASIGDERSNCRAEMSRFQGKPAPQTGKPAEVLLRSMNCALVGQCECRDLSASYQVAASSATGSQQGDYGLSMPSVGKQRHYDAAAEPSRNLI